MTDGQQKVCINVEKSKWGPITSGAIGSVFAPLFIIYMNDIDEGINSDVSKFGDDTKIGRQIISDVDARRLHDDLNKSMLWSEKWQMVFNTDKSKVI